MAQTHTASMPPPLRVLIVGAGSRGTTYAQATDSPGSGVAAVVAAVAEPIAHKRRSLGRKHIWTAGGTPSEGQEFSSWTDFLAYELERRSRVSRGDRAVPPGVDAVFVCVRDELHRDVVVGLAPLNLHLMCEKPLATTLADCLAIYRALLVPVPDGSSNNHLQRAVFSVGHVLRYTPHNLLLRSLLLDRKVIGDVASVVHTEPIGWWHFAHSYVRGNWRDSATTGPSLLTKSCHDMDLLLWLLCSPSSSSSSSSSPHLPSTISSTGGLRHFCRARKPKAAGAATNCLACPLGHDPKRCRYSARHIYLASPSPGRKSLADGNTDWPVNVVLPEIEDVAPPEREAALAAALAEDYDDDDDTRTAPSSRNWFGRCVFESDNNVCDEQTVTMTWDGDDDDDDDDDDDESVPGHHPKTAVFHMVALTNDVCKRRSHFYGTDGELTADSDLIRVTDFLSGKITTYTPPASGASRGWHDGHGGGDAGLTWRFLAAVDAVKNRQWTVRRAQDDILACTLDEVLRSHCAVFAAEEARASGQTIRWQDWWAREVGPKLLQI